MPRKLTTRRNDASSARDADLARLASSGDAAAFRTIMERNNRRLYRVARSVLRNDSDAEEVVQEAYLRAFRALPSFRAESSLSTWLTRIALNEALQRARRHRTTLELESMEEESNRASAELILFPGRGDADPERGATSRQVGAMLERALDALPEQFRVVFVMRAIEEFSIEETAESLGIPPATVKTRFHRARNALRRALEAELGPALTDVFNFGGKRCARFTEAMLVRLGLADAMPPVRPDTQDEGEKS